MARSRSRFDQPSRWAKRLRAAALAVIALIVADAVYLIAIWPDFSTLERGVIPKSAFIKSYEAERKADRSLPALRFRPTACSDIPEHVGRIFVLAEDSRFWQHAGVDWEAISDAVLNNWREGRLAFGASSISQQTAKNLFLSAARTPLRKWHELVLTYAMELSLDKTQILCLYLNIAELGHGIYGVGAAAQVYFDTTAAGLNRGQSIELAATLPSPKKHNPQTRTLAFEHRRQKIFRFVRVFGT